jgi:large repetitive protein
MLTRPYLWGGTRRFLFFLPLAAGMLCFWLPPAARAAAPTISGFSPSFGQPGNVVTITGSGFTEATLVEINTFSPTPADFTIISDTQLQLVVPLGAISGPLQLLTGASSVKSAASFLVAPVITGFSPAGGASPTVVFIQGANFITNGTTVVFSGKNASVSGNVVALTQLTAVVPAGAVTGPITVITSAGTNVSTNNFINSSAPAITGFSPGAAAIGASVTIFGGNFFAPVTVEFNGKAAANSIVSTSQLNATVPPGATTGPITVTTTEGAITTTSNLVTGIGPIITDFSPTLGTSSTAVTIDGLNLASATSVTFNGKAAIITEDLNSQLEVYPPSGSGIGPIKVTTAQGSVTTTTNFTNSASAIVTDFNPVLGSVGTTVTIDGLNFSSVTGVTFNGASAAFSVVGAGGTQISATVPTTASTGPITVRGAASSYTTTSNFTVTTAAPVITGFTPASGVRGQSVTLTGVNFSALATPAVEFNGVSAAYQTPTSTTELLATVPAGASTGTISVINSHGSGTSASLFYLQPWITSLSSTSAVVNATLTVTGRNFLDASSMRVNGVNYNYSASASQISATVPSNASTGLIEIVAPGGVIISTNLFAILPQIDTFAPALGPPGTLVTISGTSLFDVTGVQFGGVNAPDFTAATNQLQVIVPTGGKSGPITVLTPYGKDVSSNRFTVTEPSLLVLTKTASPVIAGPGTNVTFTLLVTNEGPSIVTGLAVTDSIPALLSFVSAGSTVGNCAYSNDQVVCNIGILTNNTSATIQVVALPVQSGAITNLATMGFAEGNLAASNNAAFAATYSVSDAQRTLNIAPQTNPPQIVVTWPQSSVDFLLQRSTNLALSNGWLLPSELPFLSNGLNTFTDSPPASGAFFRLKSP